MPNDNLNGLTKREQEVAELLIKGLKVSEVAEQLNLSSSTISKYRERIYLKKGVNNVIELYKKMEAHTQ